MKRSGFSATASAALASALLLACQARAEERVRFDLPAGALRQSLLGAGSTGKVNIVFLPRSVAGKRAPEVAGVYSVPEVLDRLLAGTGLRVMHTPGGSYVISEIPEAPVPPVAQPAAVDVVVLPPEPVVVTGPRGSLAVMLRERRLSIAAVDSLTAADIAKTPDSNAAEAIQRVSGVATARDQGEGRTIAVRGLGPEFTRVEINGIEAQVATDGLAQGTNRSRGFDFNVFPSDLFSRIDIEKTSRADMPEGSLGATVGMMTPRPFDRAGPRLQASWQASYNDLSQRSGSRGALLVSNTFDGDRFGLLVSVSTADTPLELQGVNSGGWNLGTANGGFCRPTADTGGLCDVPAGDLQASLAAYDLANQATAYHPRFYRYTNLIGQLTRRAAVASLQWQASDDTLLSLDLLASRFRTERYDHFLEAIGFSRGAAQAGKPEIVPRRVVLDGNGTMVHGLFDNVDIRAEHGVDDFTTDFLQTSLTVRHRFTPRLSFEGVVAQSRSDFDNAREVYAQIDRYNVDGYAFDIRGEGQNHPVLTYNFDVTDPDSWYFGPRVTQPGGTGATSPELRLRPNFTRYAYNTIKGRFDYAVSDATDLRFGFEAKRYAFRAITYRFDLGEGDFPAPSRPLSELTHLFCGEEAIAPPAGTPRCWREPDIDAFAAEYRLFDNSGRSALSTTNVAARGSNQAVTEDDLALFAQLTFRRQLFGLPAHGNGGLRIVRTGQTSTFYDTVPTTGDPDGFALSKVRRSYIDALPSFNLVIEPSLDSAIRFGVARLVARAPLPSLAGASSVVVQGGQTSVTTGNPYLEPFRATSFDLAYEWYPASGGFASLGLFHKEVSTYVQRLTHIAAYSTTGLPSSLLQGTGVTPADDFTILNFVNTRGGPLSGVELNVQQPFRTLPGAWSGLGVLFSYTYITSNIRYQADKPTGTATLDADFINVSRHASNTTLYYERGRVKARIAANYRDRYLTVVPGPWTSDAAGTDAATYWDCALSYSLTPRLMMTFEGLNLTREPNVTWDHQATRLQSAYWISGRQVYLGLRYTY
ncbi:MULTISPECIES: TonB-dependent receptor [Asticcacaulis]|uniref:TonB-dependent receptor n=1 Tax=Asticcacaulis TaxID=76890 RepID=UPI001AE745FD|nr:MULTISPECIES: TonB-dependent receptor [Asticcacaulis]MBP2161148.1 TonB-dependent receptor [Asticcacaulis solisilvae]MDR6802193.1 TonB-dependent receptor [Asticcacaulis sp. BE141]